MAHKLNIAWYVTGTQSFRRLQENIHGYSSTVYIHDIVRKGLHISSVLASLSLVNLLLVTPTLAFLSLLQDRLDASCVYPHLRDIREVSLKVAVAIAANKYATGQASVLPKPVDLEAHIRSVMYEPSY